MSTIYSARFIDSERTNIEVLRTTDEEGVYDAYIFPSSDTKQLDAFLEEAGVDLEWLHLQTKAWIKDEVKLFERTAIDIAVDRDLITGGNVTPKDLINKIVELTNAGQDDENYLAFIFDLKMHIFEMDEVKNSKNTRAKGTLRKTRSIAEILTILEKLTDV